MTTIDVSRAGHFMIGRDLKVMRFGFGAMRITGPGIWGEPSDRAQALQLLRRLPELGIDFIDTAESYGPYVSEELIAEALAPYGDMRVTTKGGVTRGGPNDWGNLGRPEFLRQGVLLSLRRLKLERLDLWQLHRIDSKVPRDEQFGAVADMIAEGLIKHAGLSEVTVEEIEAARKYFPVATVQNRYNLTDRSSEAVLEYCEAHQIGFMPYFPLGAGELFRSDASAGRVTEICETHGASFGQIALAWLLHQSPVMLPIPGTSKLSHLLENAAATGIALSSDEVQQLGQVAAGG